MRATERPADPFIPFLEAHRCRSLALDHERNGVLFFTGTQDERDVMIKTAPRPLQGVDRIENQARANDFLHRSLPHSAILIPETSFVGDERTSAAIMDRVIGESVAESRENGMAAEAMTPEDISAIVSWLAEIRRLPLASIPNHFHAIREHDWNEAFYEERMKHNAKGPINLGLLSESERGALQSLWRRHLDIRTFQHHDVVPFNFMRRPNGGLAIMDGEFARIGMTGYDPAYFAIQMYCLYDRGDLAAYMLEESLRLWDTNFPEDDLRTRILSPLAYRIVANLNDPPVKRDGSVQRRTIALKDRILQDDLDAVIAGLQKL